MGSSGSKNVRDEKVASKRKIHKRDVHPSHNLRLTPLRPLYALEFPTMRISSAFPDDPADLFEVFYQGQLLKLPPKRRNAQFWKIATAAFVADVDVDTVRKWITEGK